MTNPYDPETLLEGAIGHLAHGVLYSEADRLATNAAEALLLAALTALAPDNLDEADFAAEVRAVGLLAATFPLGMA